MPRLILSRATRHWTVGALWGYGACETATRVMRGAISVSTSSRLFARGRLGTVKQRTRAARRRGDDKARQRA